MFAGYSLWQDAARAGSMAGKSLDQTSVAFLVCEHQAQGRDWAVLAGAITYLWTGGVICKPCLISILSGPVILNLFHWTS